MGAAQRYDYVAGEISGWHELRSLSRRYRRVDIAGRALVIRAAPLSSPSPSLLADRFHRCAIELIRRDGKHEHRDCTRVDSMRACFLSLSLSQLPLRFFLFLFLSFGLCRLGYYAGSNTLPGLAGRVVYFRSASPFCIFALEIQFANQITIEDLVV